MKFVRNVAAIAAFVVGGMSFALNAQASDESYFEVQAPKTELVGIESYETQSSLLAPMVSFEELEGLEVALDKVINMGKRVWAVVEAGKPVANYSTDTGNALPEGVQSWMQLAGWKAPRAFVYRTKYENIYGITVVDFSYRVIYTFGGNVNGKGLYLTQATILPAQLDVAWGFTFNAKATIPAVTNAGSSVSPVAGMQMQLQWTVDSPLKHSESTSSYYIRGDGAFVDLTAGN